MKRDIKVGNAPCSWGVMSGFDPVLFPPYPDVLRDVAETGYEGTELGDWGFLPTEPHALRSSLSEHRLSMIGALVPVPLADPAAHATGRDTAVRTARLLAACAATSHDAPFVVLTDENGANPIRTKYAGRVRTEHGLSDDDFKQFAQGATGIAQAVRDETGLRTVFHHHCAGFIETPEETMRLLDMTPADLVGLCFDTGHWAYAGGDPVAATRSLRERIWHVHYKDCHTGIAETARAQEWDYFQALENEIYYGLGTGDIDFAAITKELLDSGYSGWVVVEDELPPGKGDPRVSALRDRSFMRGLGL